jgi:hypothetical protein
MSDSAKIVDWLAEVVGRADQVSGQSGPLDAAIARAPEVADRLIQPKISSIRLLTIQAN